MSGAPWWASGDLDGPDVAQDPLGAHLAARRGDPDGPGGHDHDPSADDRDPGGHDDVAPGEASATDQEPADHDPAICGVCPICRGWAALAGTRPEVADHLAEAARGLASVLTHLADAATAASASARQADRGTADGPASNGPSGPSPRSSSGTSRGTPPGTSSGTSPGTSPGGFRPILLEDPDDASNTGADDHPIDEDTA